MERIKGIAGLVPVRELFGVDVGDVVAVLVLGAFVYAGLVVAPSIDDALARPAPVLEARLER